MTVEKIKDMVDSLLMCNDAEEAEWICENKVFPALFEDYDVTLSYIKQISKEHMNEIVGGADELVEHFNSMEMAQVIKERFYALLGDEADPFDKKIIDELEDFVK